MSQSWLHTLTRLCCGKVTFGVALPASLQSSVLEEGQLAELEH